MIWLFSILWCVFAAIGDVLYKAWSVAPQRPPLLLVAGSAAYMADTFMWAFALTKGLPIGKGSVLMCMLSMLTGVAIGVAYHEQMSIKTWAGVALALGAILCLE